MLLRRSRSTSVRARPSVELVTVRVQGDQVPVAEVEAVVPLVTRTRRAGLPTGPVEVVEVAPRARGPVLVVADDRVDDRLHTSPRRVERGLEVRRGTDVVLRVAQRQHGGDAAVHE